MIETIYNYPISRLVNESRNVTSELDLSKLDLTNVPIGKTMRLYKKDGEVKIEDTIDIDISKCP